LWLKVLLSKDGVANIISLYNIGDEELTLKGERNLRVYVINQRKQSLMPITPSNARKLLRDGKARVVNRTPFTIQLLYSTGESRQDITLGIDAGSKTIGVSAGTEKEELYTSEIALRNDIVGLLSEKRQYRRTRRNRLRYRKPRFLNRNKNKGWLAPSIQHKINSHLKIVEGIHKILPVSKIIAEVAGFDIQKIKNPDIQGEEYQQGGQLDFWNVREYVLFRDDHKCQHCHGKSKDKILNVHHIESRKTGGDTPDNLITLCETCHNKYHKSEIQLKVKRGRSFKDAAFMGIMRWEFYNRLKEMYPEVSLTYGYITKNTRISHGLEKTHAADAYCIAGNLEAKRSNMPYTQKFVRKNNRSLHKANIRKGGIRKENKAPYVVHGFRLFDKVLYDDQECFVFGRRKSGYFDLRTLDGAKVHASANCNKLRLLEMANSLLTERSTALLS